MLTLTSTASSATRRATFCTALEAAFTGASLAVSVNNGPVESISAPAAVVVAGTPYREADTLTGESITLDVLLFVNRTIEGPSAFDDLDTLIDTVRDACDGYAGYQYGGVNSIGDTGEINGVVYWAAEVAVTLRGG